MRQKIVFATSIMVCCMFLSFQLHAQKTVTGTVLNSTTSAAIDLATVTVKGTKQAVTTSGRGEFSIVMPAGKTVLVITSVGFVGEQISIAGNTSDFKILLKEN